jgi:hypothetical protein
MTEEDLRTWLVECTYPDDERNLVILVHATRDGERYLRKERALTSFTGSARDAYAAIDAPVEDFGTVTDPEERERYASEAERMAERHDPTDTI